MMPFAKKSLGQHFLHHPHTLQKIVSLAHVSQTDFVLEIGPGPGKLTDVLAETCGRFIAVEKDARFALELTERFRNNPRVVIREEDFLKTDLKSLLETSHAQEKVKVVANLPYNVASPIIFKLLDHRDFFSHLYLMVQKEVADRLTARPGTKDYSVLSIMSQLHSQNTIVLKLPPGAFQPPPKVHSAIVHFDLTRPPGYAITNKPLFDKIVRGAFQQRRKMIRNGLQDVFPQIPYEMILKALNECALRETERPENISINGFIQLTRHFFETLSL